MVVTFVEIIKNLDWRRNDIGRRLFAIRLAASMKWRGIPLNHLAESVNCERAGLKVHFSRVLLRCFRFNTWLCLQQMRFYEGAIKNEFKKKKLISKHFLKYNGIFIRIKFICLILSSFYWKKFENLIDTKFVKMFIDFNRITSNVIL